MDERGRNLRRVSREERGEQNDRGMKRETHAIYIPHRHRSLCNERRKGARSIPLQVVEKSRRSERIGGEKRERERERERAERRKRVRGIRVVSKKRAKNERAPESEREGERERERKVDRGWNHFRIFAFLSASHGHAAPNLIISRATPLYHLISDL